MSIYSQPLYYPFKQDSHCLQFLIWTRQNCELDEIDNFCLYLLYLLLLLSLLEPQAPGIICIFAITFCVPIYQVFTSYQTLRLPRYEKILDFQELSPEDVAQMLVCSFQKTAVLKALTQFKFSWGKKPNFKYLNKDPQYFILNPWCQICFRI